ncbi:MAG: alpha/beta hydrolase family protein, partial [Candidatus Thorarchaeota archaeon]
YIYLAEYVSKKNENFLEIKMPIIGTNTPLNNGISLGFGFDQLDLFEKKIKFPSQLIISFTKALMPSQLFLISLSKNKMDMNRISSERVLGIPEKFLSEGETFNYKSFDGLQISSRLYLPSKHLNYSGPRPLVLYVHGGPTGQERPDFTWFSMPIIQYLTLHGFVVFVPNVRGSTGYGYSYMAQVFHDWGGKDMRDHIEGLKKLEQDSRIDSTKRFVMGRSYGGFMTLSLMSRHPDLWTGGCDLFGPYDLLGFYDRLPGTWKESMKQVLGDPDKEDDKNFLIERSPKTYMNDLIAPLLVIQGRNDPRVLAKESEEIVDLLREKGNKVDIIIYEDEGHDVIKIKNKIDCYEKITSFFLDLI